VFNSRETSCSNYAGYIVVFSLGILMNDWVGYVVALRLAMECGFFLVNTIFKEYGWGLAL